MHQDMVRTLLLLSVKVAVFLVSLPLCHKESGMLPGREDPSQCIQVVKQTHSPTPKQHHILPQYVSSFKE